MSESWPVEVSPETAEEAMRERQAVYLDVRTVEEFEAGHPPGALNVPILFLDAPGGQPRPNPEFLAVVRAHVAPDAEVYCGCRSGPRSLQATMLLRQAGYPRVSNVDGGFHGKTGMLGMGSRPGWLDRGLPVAEGDGGPLGWESLRAAVEDPRE